jgi:hypothetical protein
MDFRGKTAVITGSLSVEEVADATVRLVTDETLRGCILVWWPEDAPRLISWADRGYRELV